MACYHPLKAFRSQERNPETGRYGIVFNSTKALVEGSSLSIPCGRCIGCRMDKSYQWATRCLHESKMHKDSIFITLTYDDQNVPASYGLDLRHWQLFMKRLRDSKGTTRIRFFAVGEYGERLLRPHYHALIFGTDFTDKKLLKHSQFGPVYHSEALAKLWPMGSHEIGNVTIKSAGYCARYSMKKITGDRANEHYARVSPIDGNIYNVRPEFCVMSRRPGIGEPWLRKYQSDAFNISRTTKGRVVDVIDYVVVDGQRRKPPAYYMRKLREEDQTAIKRVRKRHALKTRHNNTPARLAVREEIQQVRAKRLHRKLES